MKTKTLIILLIIITNNLFAQVQYPHTSTNTGGAERVSSFGISQYPLQRFEITNGTVVNDEFIPALWAHNGVNNRHVLQIHATTTDDTGSDPLIRFIASIPTTIDINGTNNKQFPWGDGGTQNPVLNRPLFSWENGHNPVMLLSSQNFLGIGTTTPSALLHTNGTVRLENIPTTTSNTYVLTTDSNGNVERQLSTSIGGNDYDWLDINGDSPSSINDDIYSLGKVGINTANPSANLHVNGSVKLEGLVSPLSFSYDVLVLDNDLVRKVPSTVFEDKDWLGLNGSSPNSINDDIYSMGKVGVNTSNPTANLHVKGSVKLETIFTPFSDYNLLVLEDTGLIRKVDPSTLFENDSDWFDLNGDNPNLITDDIYSLGKVGINTTAPTANLHSKGSVRFQSLQAKEIEYYLGVDREGYVYKKLIGNSGNNVKRIDELEKTINIQQKQIDELINSVSKLMDDDSKNNKAAQNVSRLIGNIPNPFDDFTEVRYFVSKEIITAKLLISDANGKKIKSYPLHERGSESKLIINALNLQTGIYFYSLITNGSIIDTKKMILK